MEAINAALHEGKHHSLCVDHDHHHDEPCLDAAGRFHVLDENVAAVLGRPVDDND